MTPTIPPRWRELAKESPGANVFTGAQMQELIDRLDRAVVALNNLFPPITELVRELSRPSVPPADAPTAGEQTTKE